MKLVIPLFHAEFDALQVLSKRFGEIPPFGVFGDFWWLLWLFSRQALVSKFNDMPFRRAHGVEDLIMNIWELKYILKIVLNMLINPITIEGENCRFVFKHHGAC